MLTCVVVLSCAPGASSVQPNRAQVVGLQRQWVMSRNLAAARVALIKWLLEAGSRQATSLANVSHLQGPVRYIIHSLAITLAPK